MEGENWQERGLRQWWLSWISFKNGVLLCRRVERWRSQNGKDHVVCLSEKAPSLDLLVSERSPAIAGSAYFPVDKIKAWKIICKESEGRPSAFSWESRYRRWLMIERTVSTYNVALREEIKSTPKSRTWFTRPIWDNMGAITSVRTDERWKTISLFYWNEFLAYWLQAMTGFDFASSQSAISDNFDLIASRICRNCASQQNAEWR